MVKQYYYHKRQNKIIGPFPAAHFQAMRRSGTLSREDLLSMDKITWTPAAEIEWLYQAQAIPVVREEAPPSVSEPISLQKPVAQTSALEPIPLRKPAVSPPVSEPIPLRKPTVPAPALVVIEKFELAEELTEEEDDAEEELPASRIVGEVITLTWNAVGHLPALGKNTSTAIAAALAISLLLFVLGGAACTRLFAIGIASGILTGLAMAAALWLLTWCEIKLAVILFAPPERQRQGGRHAVLLASAVLLILSMAVITFYATVHLFQMSFWLAAILNLGIWGFTTTNVILALRVGLTHFYGMSPRISGWVAEVIQGINLTLIFFKVYVYFTSKGL